VPKCCQKDSNPQKFTGAWSLEQQEHCQNVWMHESLEDNIRSVFLDT